MSFVIRISILIQRISISLLIDVWIEEDDEPSSTTIIDQFSSFHSTSLHSKFNSIQFNQIATNERPKSKSKSKMVTETDSNQIGMMMMMMGIDDILNSLMSIIMDEHMNALLFCQGVRINTSQTKQIITQISWFIVMTSNNY